ncbi:Uncharacterized conserved protein, DUF58 family, contains vWF domain [Pseudomonas linyingensis]|uniref:Uncharacterized conserved protein, DUF58 family, contains vWF domain n=1 Tax=Pseudomonas linyingensis TaxID=915471 RepID=A0A1H6SQV8_9PSED|nr:DUF58 domain-containing protein [Pseudomonas linyingensis]SEI66430.1 Uncharacterized conserved protein, DUF58 family, contains vWF domain [Pseudomonas linyingensis]
MKPSPRLLALAAALLLAAILLGALPLLGIALPAWLDGLWWGSLLALAGVALFDALWLRRRPSPTLQRQLPGHLALDRGSEVVLRIAPGAQPPRWLELFDHVPAALEFSDLPQRIALSAEQGAELRYRVRPRQRGDCRFARCEIGLPSPLGLWQARRYVELPGHSRVYPDFARLHGAQLMAVDSWLGRLGVRTQPRRGSGQEFHQLRDFRSGDSLRQIDWKATARKHQPIAREYQDERDQQIVFLLDSGRRMRSQDGDLSHFDHALNACLLLAHVAMRQGDAVGLLTFAGDTPCYLPPAKGRQQLNALLNSVYDLQPGQLPGDFQAAASELLARQPRRALVVLLSNLRDEDDQQLPLAAAQIARRHRLLIASLREEVLDRQRRLPVESYSDALSYCGTVDYAAARTRLHERFAAQGLPVLDVRPGELGPELVNRYLQWKAAGTL